MKSSRQRIEKNKRSRASTGPWRTEQGLLLVLEQEKTVKETKKKRVNGEKQKEESQQCAILVQKPRKKRVLRKSSVLNAAKVEYDEGRMSVNLTREWSALTRTI